MYLSVIIIIIIIYLISFFGGRGSVGHVEFFNVQFTLVLQSASKTKPSKPANVLVLWKPDK